MLNTQTIKSLTDLRLNPMAISQLAKDEGPVYIFNRNRLLSVVLDIKDYEARERMLDMLEDRLDALVIQRKESGTKKSDLIPWEKVKKDLGL